MSDSGFWHERRVFITGHTGFKGGWLAAWCQWLGARVCGYALEAPTRPSLFEQARIEDLLEEHHRGDVRDPGHLREILAHWAPEIVFHLAAQPLVRESYRQPLATYAVNLMGTVHLLEAVRAVPTVRSVVIVTSDKCYENREWCWPYREEEPLGGHDPYSSSKACAELATAAYRRSFLAGAGIAVATARAGNVIGGGDWASERLIPDLIRAWLAGEPLQARAPHAVRPWQHVLEPLSGYLLLARRLYEHGADYAQAWNFGPQEGGSRPVSWLLDQLCARLPEANWSAPQDLPDLHEAGSLRLDSARAHSQLGWTPRWSLEQALARTLDWYCAWHDGADMQHITREQIRDYQGAGQ